MTMTIDTTRNMFLRAAFPTDLMHSREAVLLARMTERGIRQQLHHPRSKHEPGPWYYCVSTVRRTRRDTFPRRRMEDLMSAWVLPCDDVGTKADPPPVEPSYIIETSGGNYQYGYFIDPFDVTDAAGAAYYDACLLALAAAGYNDPGCRGAARIVRLPGSLHKTGFVARLTEWSPDRTWPLKGLMRAMGVKVDNRLVERRRRQLEPSPLALGDVADPLLDWLSENGYTLGTHTDTWVHLRCPWQDGHTGGQGGATATGYSPLDYGHFGRSFNCFHGHCQGRTVGDLAQFIARQGGPSF